MDIKEKIEEIVAKIKAEPDFANDFKTNPVKAVEKVLGIDLPDDIVEKVIDGVKSKVSFDDIADKVGGILDMFKKD